MCSSEYPTKTPGPIGLSPPSSEGRSGLVHPGTDDRQAASSTEYYYTSRSYTYEQKQQERALTYMEMRSIMNRNATTSTTTNMRSILDAIRGDVPLFAPGRQLANSALHKRPGESGPQPRAASCSYIRSELQGGRGSESRAPSGRRHRWKATPRRLGHPTRAIYHRHVMRVLIWSSQRSTTRHNGSDATAQFQLVRGQFTFSHGHSQSCAQVQGKGGEMD